MDAKFCVCVCVCVSLPYSLLSPGLNQGCSVCVCVCLIPFCPLLALVTARPRILLKRTGAETTILLSLLLPVCQSVCPSGPRFLLPFAHLHTSVRVLAFDPSVHPSAYLATQISSFSADSRFLGLGIW